MPGPAPSVYSPFIRCGMPQANSTTSTPRWMSPLASAIVLPCSRARQSASLSLSRATRSTNFISTRARRCGLVAAQAGCAALAFSTAARDLGLGGQRHPGAHLRRPSAGTRRRTGPIVPFDMLAADEMAVLDHGRHSLNEVWEDFGWRITPVPRSASRPPAQSECAFPHLADGGRHRRPSARRTCSATSAPTACAWVAIMKCAAP